MEGTQLEGLLTFRLPRRHNFNIDQSCPVSTTGYAVCSYLLTIFFYYHLNYLFINM